MLETAEKSLGCDAVVLLSGGLDSAVVLAMARRRGLACVCLSIDYGQRHRHELEQARKIAKAMGAVEHIVLELDMRGIGASALTSDIAVPKPGARVHSHSDLEVPSLASVIPVTYVPARNLIFLSLAAGLAEARGCREVHIGVNAVDYSGYPDCRPEFIDAFARACNLATRAGVEEAAKGDRGPWMRIVTPLIGMRKAEIIGAGHEAELDFALTHSCYDPVEVSLAQWGACGECDSCQIRARGFVDAGLTDPTVYAPGARPEFRG